MNVIEKLNSIKNGEMTAKEIKLSMKITKKLMHSLN